MTHTHNYEDFWATGYDKCLDCGAMKRSSISLHEVLSTRVSNISISLTLSSGEVIEGL